MTFLIRCKATLDFVRYPFQIFFQPNITAPAGCSDGITCPVVGRFTVLADKLFRFSPYCGYTHSYYPPVAGISVSCPSCPNQ